MGQAVYTLGPNAVSSGMLTLVFLVLWHSHRERYLGVWALAWLLFTVRYVYGMVGDNALLLPTDVVVPFLAVARGIAMLWGAHAMAGRTLPKGWLVAAGLDLGVLAWDQLGPAPLTLGGAVGVSHYALFGACLIRSGMIVIRRLRTPGWGATLAGTCFVLMGALQVTYPWAPVLPPMFAATAFLTVHVTNLGIAVGILLAFFADSEQRNLELSERLAAALTRVLEDFLPVCAHCHAVRDESGVWHRLEGYVTARTGTQLSHGICPDCEETHFGHL